MNRSKLTQYDTPFQKLMVERYADSIPDTQDTSETYRAVQNFLFTMEAAEQYEVEDKMMKYALDHPNCSVRDLSDYFDSIVPSGTLPPCAVDWDDDE